MLQTESNSQGKKTQTLLSVERNSSSTRQKTAAVAQKNKVLISSDRQDPACRTEVIMLLQKKISLAEVKMRQAESLVFTDE